MALNLKNNGIFYLSRVCALNIDRFVAIANGVDSALLLTSFNAHFPALGANAAPYAGF
ncbi:MAG: hypothetical protein LBC09_06350 [Helicobacteraceae bacterium]|jgi:hypothetical protein|nr:hypothetical protein [Helicobacteraceae bacterium]